ncbi:MAG TPA: hypothetical protein VJ715_14785 [Pyrinomonadaceae bacterium]|nr:hypothetical protein [Pyrinomonadaceae bacterium]
MPGTPSLVAGDMDTGSGNVFSTRYTLETPTAGYIVGYTDLPVAADDPAKIKQAMDISRENLLKDGTKLLSEKDIVLDGYPGRELILHGEGVVYRMRSYYVKTRHYQVMLITPVNVTFKTGQPSADSKDRTDLYETISRKYMDSFKLKAGLH